MKLTQTATKDTEILAFMKEGWLQDAVKELDRANLTPEQRSELEMIIAGNMSEKEAFDEKVDAAKKGAKLTAKKESIAETIKLGLLTDEQLAMTHKVSIEFVKKIRKEIEK